MIARTSRVTGWLALGFGVVAGMYWLFVNTPETNAVALATSVALLVGMLLTAALVINTAVRLSRGARFVDAIKAGIRGIPWFVVILIPLGAVWWALNASDAWVSNHAGEINAWFIARFGWADVSPLFGIAEWSVRWLGWVVAPLAGLTLLAARLEPGGGRTARDSWLRRAWHWRTLAPATIIFLGLFVLPWQLTAWRPELPPTWVEPVVAAARLGVVGLLWSIGAALLVALSSSTRPGAPAPPPTVAEPQ